MRAYLFFSAFGGLSRLFFNFIENLSEKKNTPLFIASSLGMILIQSFFFIYEASIHNNFAQSAFLFLFGNLFLLAAGIKHYCLVYLSNLLLIFIKLFDIYYSLSTIETGAESQLLLGYTYCFTIVSLMKARSPRIKMASHVFGFISIYKTQHSFFTYQGILFFFLVCYKFCIEDKFRYQPKPIQSQKPSPNAWELFLKNILPNSIVIYTPNNSKKPFFVNNAFLKEFNCSDDQEIFSKLKILSNEQAKEDLDSIFENSSTLYNGNQTTFKNQIHLLLTGLANTAEGKYLALFPTEKNIKYEKKIIKVSYAIYECCFKRILWKDMHGILFEFKEKIIENILKNHSKLKSRVTSNIATIAHELKTPISLISAECETLDDEMAKTSFNMSEEIKTSVKKLMNFAKYQKGLISSLLDNAQLAELGRILQLNISEFSAKELLEELKQFFSYQIKTRNLYFKTKINPPDSYFKTDKDRLMQIMINLISNSIKFTIKGGVTVEINQNLISNLSSITVEDSGVGIPNEIMKKLFSPYSSFGRGNIENCSGTGLGLIISKNYVSLLGPSDEMKVDSEEGKYSKFSFSISTRIEDKKNNNTKSLANGEMDFVEGYIPASTKESLLNLPPKILQTPGGQSLLSRIQQNLIKKEDLNELNFCIVDDEPFLVAALKKWLEQLGATKFQEFFDGSALLEALNQSNNSIKIDVLIIDYFMPILSGIETIDKLSKMNYPIKSTVIYSAHEFDELQLQNLQCNFVLNKPASLSTVSFLIIDILEKEKSKVMPNNTNVNNN